MSDLADQFCSETLASSSQAERDALIDAYAASGRIIAQYRMDQAGGQMDFDGRLDGYWPGEEGRVLLFADYSAMLMVLSDLQHSVDLTTLAAPSSDEEFRSLSQLLALTSPGLQRRSVQTAPATGTAGSSGTLFMGPTEISGGAHGLRYRPVLSR
ncbi:hypothetical protein F2Q65_15440 [Thiohalocapsa marina]|uniref:Uncharacterized protein n=1 Tax=Thiohalocapsa marina TaxID=424902 RepID=A0A5M8FFC0_9GAMM|nr:hypothetical protein [Thiohalocapsa marina]KAA6183583.1 hypothetical protein F2Q65_15440 [Thiohalocapsa marina]